MAALSFRSSAPWLVFALLGGLNAAMLGGTAAWLGGGGDEPREGEPAGTVAQVPLVSPSGPIVEAEAFSGASAPLRPTPAAVMSAPASTSLPAARAVYGPPAPATEAATPAGWAMATVSPPVPVSPLPAIPRVELSRLGTLPAWSSWALGGLTLGLWALAGTLVYRERMRALAAERRSHWQALASCFPAQGSALDVAGLRAAWPLQLASAVLAGPQPGGCFVEARPLSDHCVGFFVGAASSAPAQALIGRGLTTALWRALAAPQTAPGETLLALNRLLVDYVPQGQHVTAFYAQLDTLSGALAYASAAHSQAYVLTAEGEWSLLPGRGMPLGIGQELFAERLTVGAGRLREGESLWIFTEGLLKVENPQGESFGSLRLEKWLRAHARAGAAELVGRLKARLRGFAGGQALPLDAAVLCFKIGAPVPFEMGAPVPIDMGAPVPGEGSDEATASVGEAPMHEEAGAAG